MFNFQRKVLLVLVIGLLAGCNSKPKLIPISGKVTIDGKPLKQGTVTVWVSDYRPAAGKINKEGRYILSSFKDGDGCLPGEYPVTIASEIAHGDISVEYFAPKIYSRPEDSKLKIKVDQPRDDANFDLTWKVDPQHKGPSFTEK